MILRTLLISAWVFFGACGGDDRDASGGDGGPTGSDGGVESDSSTSLDDSGTMPRDAATPRDGSQSTAPEVDPNCDDGMYTEVLPIGTADISDIAYPAASLKDFALDVLDARYPTGAWIVRGCIDSYSEAECVDRWVFDASSREQFFVWLNFIVHEGGHMFDLAGTGFGTYKLTPETTLRCTGGDTVARGGMTFARSELLTDAYQADYRACESDEDRNCDGYAYTYFVRNGAEQGFSSVLEETVQYINSLAVGWMFADEMSSGRITSARDGLLAFLWYIERYLHIARLEQPEAYAALAESECWRNAILTVWGRAWLYLEATEGMRNLEISGEIYDTALHRSELIDEIDRLRTAQCGD